MKTAMIIGPYRAGTHNKLFSHITFARHIATIYWAKGIAVICPQTNTAFMSGVCDEKIFLEGYKKFLILVDMVIVLPGWETSRGSKAEVKLAKLLKKEIIYV